MNRIAVIAGDGIGKETVPEGLRVLEAAAAKFALDLKWDHFDFASCDYYAKHGQMMPDDWKDQIGGHDAIFFGAVGWPDTVPDHVSLWGSLIKFRREFDQYVNLRPCRLMPGVPSPLANRHPGDIDFYVVRENTEGEYSSVGGRMYEGTERGGGAAEHVLACRHRPHPEVCVRSGAESPEEAPDLGDQVEWHFDHHAVLGRTGSRDVEKVWRHPGR
jgi:isocitrate/isopropylmalate dehydrogenase